MAEEIAYQVLSDNHGALFHMENLDIFTVSFYSSVDWLPRALGAGNRQSSLRDSLSDTFFSPLNRAAICLTTKRNIRNGNARQKAETGIAFRDRNSETAPKQADSAGPIALKFEQSVGTLSRDN